MRPDATGSFALDQRGLDALRHSARTGDADATKKAARQFEAEFLGLLMKSMRDTLPKEDALGGTAGRTYQDMLDRQWTQGLSGRGLGLAEVIERQLSRMNGTAPAAPDAGTPGAKTAFALPAAMRAASAGAATGIDATAAASALHVGASDAPPAQQDNGMPSASAIAEAFARLAARRAAQTGASVNAAAGALERTVNDVAARVARATGVATARATETTAAVAPAARGNATQRSFIERIGAHAEQAARVAGLPARFIVGHAALESGWGKREIVGTDGTRSHNLFGIKAGGQWNGPTVQSVTTEVIGGVARKVVQSFRAYGSYAEAFNDYAKMLSGNPRYAGAVRETGDAGRFAAALQRGGYATDPAYADKLERTIRSATRVAASSSAGSAPINV